MGGAGFRRPRHLLPPRVQPPGLQDPKLAKWWAEAANYRRRGDDRVLVPAPWTATIEELCADGVQAEVYAHEQVSVEPGRAGSYLEEVAERGQSLYGEHGWKLIGAWETAMVNESEAFLLWAVPTWEQWGQLEAAERAPGPFRTYRQSTFGQARDFHRFLLVDAPLSPLRTGRQPQVTDRDPSWQVPPRQCHSRFQRFMQDTICGWLGRRQRRPL